MRPVVAVAVFAHNEARTIRAALESVIASAGTGEMAIAVLVNGCRDDTPAIVRQLSSRERRATIVTVEIPLADKANAWNVYVHDVASREPFARADMHVFTDGDVRIEPGALVALRRALAQMPTANAAGGVPISGRDRDGWRARMVGGATLAGGLYALRGTFVACLRAQAIRIPVGLIGEDWLVSLLARSNLQATPSLDTTPRIVFASDAGFSFRSLSRFHPWDQRLYARRLWRYALRGAQFEMLVPLLGRETLSRMPRDVRELYRRGGMPSRLKWVGRTSLLRTLAVQWIRAQREPTR
jgi:glycosyltransferase involved in cell wall biosynthesis